jgi:hypothetical protein
MKILKYIIFLSILSGIFFVVYHQSDKKGFGRVWMFLKMAAVIAAILAGLIPANTEAIKPAGNNTQVYQERLLSEQEFNSFEDNNGQVLLAKVQLTVDRVISRHHLREVDLVGLYTYPNIVSPRKPLIKDWVQEPIQLEQAVVVELLNLMISLLFQKTKNHKNQKFLSMIIL